MTELLSNHYTNGGGQEMGSAIFANLFDSNDGQSLFQGVVDWSALELGGAGAVGSEKLFPWIGGEEEKEEGGNGWREQGKEEKLEEKMEKETEKATFQGRKAEEEQEWNLYKQEYLEREEVVEKSPAKEKKEEDEWTVVKPAAKSSKKN